MNSEQFLGTAPVISLPICCFFGFLRYIMRQWSQLFQLSFSVQRQHVLLMARQASQAFQNLKCVNLNVYGNLLLTSSFSQGNNVRIYRFTLFQHDILFLSFLMYIWLKEIYYVLSNSSTRYSLTKWTIVGNSFRVSDVV